VAQAQCPNCNLTWSISDDQAGRPIRCKECKMSFVAPKRATSSGAPIPPIPPTAMTRRSTPSSTAIPEPPAPRKKTAAISTAPPPAGKAPTVVAREKGASRGGLSVGWLLAALAAFLVPVVAAAAFVAISWASKGNGPGEWYAGVEVGSKGIKYAIFEVYQHPEMGYDYRVVLTQSKRTDIVKGMEKTGQFDPEGLAGTTEAIRKCYEKLTEEDKIPPGRVFLVGSGGLMGGIRSRKDLSEQDKTKLIDQNQAALTREVKKATNKTMDFAELEEEAEFQFDGVVEPANFSTGLYIDVGSGGTRGGFRDGATRKMRKLQTAGVKGFADKVKRQRGGAPFSQAASRLAEPEVRQPLRKHIQEEPRLQQRERIYLAGGIVWVMSTCLYPRECIAPPDQTLYVDLTAQDIDTFAREVAASDNYLEAYRPPPGLSEEEKEKLNKTIKTMQKIFNGEEQKAGAEILKSISEVLKFKEKTLRFYRHSDNAWLMSYIAKHCDLKRGDR
jgi:hypothetical protein